MQKLIVAVGTIAWNNDLAVQVRCAGVDGVAYDARIIRTGAPLLGHRLSAAQVFIQPGLRSAHLDYGRSGIGEWCNHLRTKLLPGESIDDRLAEAGIRADT